MYKDFADLFNYKNLNGVECNLIEDSVEIVAEQYEDRYNIIIDKSHSKQR